MKTSEIENTRQTIEGLCKLARKLDYKDPAHQLMNSDGSCVGDLLYLLEDNQGAIEVLIKWIAENHGEEDDDDNNEEELLESLIDSNSEGE